jgi:hypothetical protein
MIIIGHELVPFKPFVRLKSAKDIKGGEVIFDFDELAKLAPKCRENHIVFAVEVTSAREALIANAAGAAYIVTGDKSLACDIQPLAEKYLFDAKVLLRILFDDELAEVAGLGIDGVLMRSGEA